MKKRTTAAIALIAAAIMVVTLAPFSAFATYRTSVGDAETPDRFDEEYIEHNCLDISSWNGDLDDDDWEAIKDAGVDSVIIRAGYSKLNTNRHKTDERFKQNIKRATKHGLDVGVYYFTSGVTTKEMTREAEYFVDIIEPYRDMINLPVTLDFETNSSGRLNWGTLRELGQDNCTKLCIAFCEVIEDAGYEPMIYASRGLFNTYLDADELEDRYAIWLAQYTSDLSATGYKGEYYIWQYSSNVRIPGIKCRFDGNYLYEKKYTALNEPKDIEAEDSDVVVYKLSGKVKSVVPAKSNTKSAEAQVTDSYGIVHDYKITKANDDVSADERIISCVLSGLEVDYAKELSKSPGSLKAYSKVFKDEGVISTRYDDEDSVYVDIKGNLANGMPVILSIDANSGPFRGSSQRLLLIGMDDVGRAIVADPEDRKWFETDQRIKLMDIDELIGYMDEGYIIIKGVK